MKTLTEQHDELVLTAIFTITENLRPIRAGFSGEKFKKLPSAITLDKTRFEHVSFNAHTNKITLWRNYEGAGWNQGKEVLTAGLLCEIADQILAEIANHKNPWIAPGESEFTYTGLQG
jgi:hypothetical protein